MFSFSQQVKSELARVIPASPCCAVAELRAFGLFGSSDRFSGELVLYRPAIARKVYLLAKKTSGQVEVSLRRAAKKTYAVTLEDGNGARRATIKRNCCARAYLRGAFLAAGYIGNPYTGHHLEVRSRNMEGARRLYNLMRRFNLPSGLVRRSGGWVTYIKEAEAVCEFLRLVGANNAVLDYENVRIVRDIKNRVNRLVNCETYNLNKSINASLRQLEDIRLIEELVGLENLAPGLRQVAEARLANPEASLKELGAVLTPRLGKSGVNHRLRKLREMAVALRQGRDVGSPAGETALTKN